MQVVALLGGAIAMTFLPETLLHNLSFPFSSDLSCSSLSFSQLMFIGGMEVGKPIQLQWSCFSPTHRRRSQSRILDWDWFICIYLQITNIYVYKCRLTKCSFTSECKTMAADAKIKISMLKMAFDIFSQKNMLSFYTLTTNIATGETSQAITPYQFFNYFNVILFSLQTFQTKDFITR